MCLANVTKSEGILCRMNAEMPVDLHQGQASIEIVSFLKHQQVHCQCPKVVIVPSAVTDHLYSGMESNPCESELIAFDIATLTWGRVRWNGESR